MIKTRKSLLGGGATALIPGRTPAASRGRPHGKERVHMLDSRWIKASASYANSNCVEVRMRADGSVEVRNSRIPGVQLPPFTPQEWAAFIDGARAGEFELPGGATDIH